MNNPDRLLTSSDVAALLNISKSMAYTLMQRGDLRVVRIGRSVRVRPDDLDEFITQQSDPPLAKA